MAAKTSTFFLTERLSLAAGVNSTAEDTIDLGAYVDVADRQGVLIHEVDFIFQGKDTANGAVTSYTQTMTADGTTMVQLSDLNRGALVFADDRALVASGELVYDSANQLSHASDLYPDNFGPSSASPR